jgi:hypothetical protein
VALWLGDVQPTVDPTTYELHESAYVGTHFAPFFETMDRLAPKKRKARNHRRSPGFQALCEEGESNPHGC